MWSYGSRGHRGEPRRADRRGGGMRSRPAPGEIVLRLLAAAGLAYSAYIHWDLRGNYQAVRTSTLSQGDLFTAQAIVAVVAAATLLVFGGRFGWLAALAVGGASLAAVLVTRYVDIGQLGPIPDMYEPVWFTDKSRSAVAEGVTTVIALVQVAILLRPRRRARAVRSGA